MLKSVIFRPTRALCRLIVFITKLSVVIGTPRAYLSRKSARDHVGVQFDCFAIHRKEKDGDWYIYLKCFAHGNFKRAYKKHKEKL